MPDPLDVTPVNPLRSLEIARQLPHGEVTGPLVESLEFSHGLDGFSAKAKYVVEDIQGPAEFILPIALSATGIPGIGETYPGMNTLPVMLVTAVLADSSTTAAVVTVEWGVPSGGGGEIPDPDDPDQPAQIEISSTVQGGTTKYDSGGKALLVTQNFEKLLDEEDGGSETVPFDEWKEVDMQRPMHVVRFSKLRNQSPGDIAPKYLGFTNEVSIFGDPPGMWLCTRLDGSSNDGGLTYQTNYEFQRAPELRPENPSGVRLALPGGGDQLGWDVVIALEGQFQVDGVLDPGISLSDGEGIKVARIYPQADFRRLNGLDVHFGPVT